MSEHPVSGCLEVARNQRFCAGAESAAAEILALRAEVVAIKKQLEQSRSQYERRFKAARHAWDVLFDPPPAQPEHARLAAHQELIDAISGVRLLKPTAEDMQWAIKAVEGLNWGKE